MYASGYSIQRLAVFQTPGTGRQMAGDERQEEVGRRRTVTAEIRMLVEIIV
jgi:hypothetical protein